MYVIVRTLQLWRYILFVRVVGDAKASLDGVINSAGVGHIVM